MKRRITKSLVCIALLLSMILNAAPALAAGTTDASNIIRVKLSVGSTTSIPVYLDGNYSIAEDSKVSLQRQLYTVKLQSGRLGLYYGDKLLYSGTSLRLVQHTETPGLNNFARLQNQKYGYRNYLGDLKFIINGSSISVINYIYLEHYLYGVVPYEMSDSWPIEALKSQTIAARTYAVMQMGAGSYDVVDTSENQVYKGYDASTTNAIAAVNATANQVLTYNGKLAYTYYSASNGGYTDIPYHVWGGGADMGYYTIQKDTYDNDNPSSPYEGVFFPVSITPSTPIYTKDNVSGTPNINNAVTYIKKRILSSKKLDSYGVDAISDFELVGVTDLYAHTYDTDGEDHSRMPGSAVNSCVDFVKATGDFMVMVGTKKVKVDSITLDLRYFDASNGNNTYKVFNNASLRLFLIETAKTGDTVKGYWIYQKRFGHGLGMSQRGAQQRANKGKSYTEILNFYYPGTKITTLSISAPTTTAIPNTTVNANATVVNCESLNVRETAGTSSNVLGTLPVNARIQVVQAFATPEWHEIIFGGSKAYVHKDYIKLDSHYIKIDSGSSYVNDSANTHKISFTIGDPGLVTVRIQDANKKTVKNIIYKQSYFAPGTYEVNWDGKNSSGKPAPSGTYYIYVIQWNDSGKYWYKSQALTYTDKLLPVINTAETYTKDSDNKHKIVFDVKFDCKVSVRVTNSSGTTMKYIVNKASYSKGRYSLYWDGTDAKGNMVPAGNYNIIVAEYDNEGSCWYAKKSIKFTLVKTPTIVTGATYTKQDSNDHLIKFSISEASKVTVRIKDAAGNTIRIIGNKQDYSAGQHSVYWDGKDTNGYVVSSGTYYVYVYRYEGDKYYSSYKKLTVTVPNNPTLVSDSTYAKTGDNGHHIQFSINRPSKVTVAIRDESKATVKNIVYKKDYTEGKFDVYWDGKDKNGNVVSSGTYYIYVIRYENDKKYYYSYQKLTVSVSEKPTITSNSAYTRTGTNRHLIKVSIAKPAVVSTCIKDVNLKTVLYLENKIAHDEGQFKVYWDGKDKSKNAVPNGTYYIYAIRYYDDGSYVYSRKKLILK